MNKLQLKRARDERGVSLIEIMVAVVILTTTLLSLAGAAALALRTTARGSEDLEVWAVVQRKADSLVARGAGNIATGSDVVEGRPISWTVGAWTAGGLNPQRIDLIVDRAAMVDLSIVKDTIVLYLSN